MEVFEVSSSKWLKDKAAASICQVERYSKVKRPD